MCHGVTAGSLPTRNPWETNYRENRVLADGKMVLTGKLQVDFQAQ